MHLARALPIGSGRAKAACKTVVRPEPEVHRHALVGGGANPVLWVRCANANGWLGDYWDERLGIRRMRTLAPTHQRFVVHPDLERG